MKRLGATLLAAALFAASAPAARAQLQPVVPRDMRGQLDAERSGFHDAANIRTVFWNFGMVGDYPPNPGNVDLSVFHSVEVPKGTGMNYSDGITPFVLAKIVDRGGAEHYLMETGFRERQAISPYTNLVERFEPRPGYFQADPNINKSRSPALSSDSNTWPATWPDKLYDPDDPGWSKSWNGYFGKRAAADQESYTIMDDDFYDELNYRPDTRDSTRHGLGLRIAVRGFQWANPQAGNVIFWHYDITNEGTTDYDDNIIFGLYMDSGVGGSGLSCDGIFESDDDNAFFDKSSALNLVYTWDVYGHGVDLRGNCSPTGYLGYAYLETPGNPFNGIDDDSDGITDERRDSGPGVVIDGQDAIRAYVVAHYDTARFRAFYGPLEEQPAFRVGRWWTGDEDMDWTPEFDDVGADGVDGTHDTGERDGIPTNGEPNFDKTDLEESDQIGLTGFKMNRIRAGQGNPDQTVDGVLFYTDSQNWPQKLYDKFTNVSVPARFDSALASNYNIGFLFASGPFKLRAGQNERFSLALAYGTDLLELRTNVGTVQQIYNANYRFAVPPPLPTAGAETGILPSGKGYVRLSWDDVAERGVDPVTHQRDFEGYRIYRSTDPDFGDVEKIRGSRGNPVPNMYKPMQHFDLVDGIRGNSRRTVEGVSFDLGDDNGIVHTWTDSSVTLGQEYYYAVTAYDRGNEPQPFDEKTSTFPSESPVAAVKRTLRGGVVLPTNIVRIRPNAPALGFVPADVTPAVHVLGDGVGTVSVQVVNSDSVRDGHLYKISFRTSAPESIRAEEYALADSTKGQVLFEHGADLEGRGIGAIGGGLLPRVVVIPVVTPDSARSGFTPGSPSNTRIKFAYQPVLSPNLRRPGYPDSITITFDDVVRDTGLVVGAGYQARPAKFIVVAHTAQGDQQLDFRFRDFDGNGTLSRADESFDILTYAPFAPGIPMPTWRVQLDTLGQGPRGPIVPPRAGDVYELRTRKPLGTDDVFVFTGRGERIDAARAAALPLKPYVVPNPYIEAASFEPARFAISGRGERRMEFRGLPANAVIRIYTVRGDLVQTLRHDGSDSGFVAWNLRTKDNLDVAPGLYVFHVEAPGMGTAVGKFGIIK